MQRRIKHRFYAEIVADITKTITARKETDSPQHDEEYGAHHSRKLFLSYKIHGKQR